MGSSPRGRLWASTGAPSDAASLARPKVNSHSQTAQPSRVQGPGGGTRGALPVSLVELSDALSREGLEPLPKRHGRGPLWGGGAFALPVQDEVADVLEEGLHMEDERLNDCAPDEPPGDGTRAAGGSPDGGARAAEEAPAGSGAVAIVLVVVGWIERRVFGDVFC